MEPSTTLIQSPQTQILPTIVSIDESWIASSQVGMKQNLLICPVCYTIPIDYPVECSKCQRIFCRKDYDKIRMSQNQQEKRCPTCKLIPWRKKQQIHLSYKHMFDSLRLKCKICEDSQEPKELQMQNESMNKDELINHLEKKHNMVLSMATMLYDFILVPQSGDEVKLSKMQNLQINVRRNMTYELFDIGCQGGTICHINLKEMRARHPILGNCKIISIKSQTLKRNKQYIVWTVDLGQNFRQHQLFDEEADQFNLPVNPVGSYFNQHLNHRYIFYSEQLQPIIQKNYQDFVKNIRYNVFCLDVRDCRYLIDFSTSRQINTFTKNRKPILRVPIVLK